MFQTIPNPGVKMITYSPEFSAICSVSNVPFYGIMHIEYYPKENMLEFESFESWLRDDVSKMLTTVEGLTVTVLNSLSKVLQKGTSIKVTIEAKTIVHGAAKASTWNDDWTL